jgi:hypothetical protein
VAVKSKAKTSRTAKDAPSSSEGKFPPVDNGPSTEGKEQSFPKPGTPAPKE